MRASVPPEMTSLASTTDEQLVLWSQQPGGEVAMSKLVARHVESVRGLVFPMVLDDGVADDLTQEAFLRALRALPEFRGKASFGTWLHRIALNTTYSYLERKQRSPVEFHARLPESAVSRFEPGSALETAELDQQVRAALAELSPKLRAAIVMTGFQQLSVRQAAGIEGCTVATMYWRIHEARKQLRSKLEPWLIQ